MKYSYFGGAVINSNGVRNETQRGEMMKCECGREMYFADDIEEWCCDPCVELYTRKFHESEVGGAIGADGNVYSDADSGL